MSLYTRDGVFWGNWTNPDTGKRHRWPLGTAVRREADRKFRDDVEHFRAMSRARQMDLLSLAATNTLEAAIDYIIAHPGDVSHWTVRAYRYHKPHLLKFFGRATLVVDVTRDRFRAFIDHERARGVSDVGAERYLATLRRALRECLDRRDADGLALLKHTPSVRGLLKRGRHAPRARYLTRDEFQTLLVAFGARRLWLVVACYTGMHSIDLHGLRWCDVDFSAATWTRRNTKNRVSPLRLDMPAPLAQALAAEWKAGAPFARGYRTTDAPRSTDVILGPWQYEGAIRAAVASTGIASFCALDCRRTCATWLAERGVSADEARRWFGHSVRSRMLEEVYRQVSPERMARAARALDFEDGRDEAAERVTAVAGAPARVLYLAPDSSDARVTQPDHLRRRGSLESRGKDVPCSTGNATWARRKTPKNKGVTSPGVTSCDAPVTQTDLQTGAPAPSGVPGAAAPSGTSVPPRAARRKRER